MSHQRLVALVGEEEAARILGLAVQTLRNWRFRRIGPNYLKIGNRAVRYQISEILDYIESRKIKIEG